MRFILVLTLMLVISGCASSGSSAKFAYKSPKAAIIPEYGYLKVYTHSNPEASYPLDGEEYEEYTVYTPYSIYHEDGSLVKQVYSSKITPATVKLAKGKYVIIAEMSKGTINSYTVNIEPGLVLEVDPTMLETTLSKEE